MPKEIFTSKARTKIYKGIRKGLSPLDAAREAGIKAHTFRQWMRLKDKQHVNFQKHIGRIEKQKVLLPVVVPSLEEQGFSGSPKVVEKKKLFVAALEQSPNIPVAAEHCGITTRTVDLWGNQDEAFALEVFSAREKSVAYVEGKLFKLAVEGKNPTAMLAYLNAHHPAYGIIRREDIVKNAMPFIDEVVKLVSKFVSRESMDSFSKELDRLIVQFATGQSFKKRRDA